MRTKICIFLLLLASFLPFSLHNLNSSTPQEKKKQETLEHEAVVTLKLVQVYVTDKKGKPVMDLEKDDFELFDNRKRKRLTDFEKHILVFSSRKPAFKQKKEPHPAPQRLNRKFFLFFDFAFNSAMGIRNSKEAALHFIDSQLQSTDEVGVLSYSTSKYLRVHENLTTNHQKVREAVEGFGLEEVLGRAEDVEQKYWGNIEKQAASSSESQQDQSQGSEMEKMKREMEGRNLEAERYHFQHQVTIFSKTIKDLAKALSHISGNKHIIFFSSGIPSSIFDGYHKAPTTIDTPRGRIFVKGSFGDALLRERYDTMVKELATSNTSVYAVYAEGITMDFDWEYGIKDRQMLGITPLQKLADDTGGKFFGNIREYKNIMEEIHNVTGSYYVLGYYIDEKWDGKYHKIKVKVRRKGCQVHAQRGFFNPKSFKKFSKLEKKLHFIDLALEEKSQFQAPISFALETFPFSEKGKSGFLMISKIPLEKREEFSGKKVEVANLIFNEQENVVDFKRWQLDFTKFPKKDTYYYSLSSVPPGKYTFRVVMRNLKTGKSAVASSALHITEVRKDQIKLYPPLLLLPEKDAFYLKGELIKQTEESKEMIGITTLYPFNPPLHIPILNEIQQGTSRLLAIIRCHTLSIQKPEIEYFLRLIDQSNGNEIPINFSVFHRNQKNETQIAYISLQTEHLKPGNYILYFFAEEKKIHSKSKVHKIFSIK